MDEVAIFNYALTAEEAGYLHTELTVPEPATMSLLVLGGLATLIRKRR